MAEYPKKIGEGTVVSVDLADARTIVFYEEPLRWKADRLIGEPCCEALRRIAERWKPKH